MSVTLHLRLRAPVLYSTVWSAVGIALVSVIGWLLYRQSLDAPAIIGIGLIVAGVVVINGFSKSVAH